MSPSHDHSSQVTDLEWAEGGADGHLISIPQPLFPLIEGSPGPETQLGKAPLRQVERACAKGIREEMSWEPRCRGEEGSPSAATKESGKRENKQPRASCPPQPLPPHLTLPTNLLQPVPASWGWGEEGKGYRDPPQTPSVAYTQV